ncbi:MAG: conjugal transfer pilus assembly protein TraK [Paraglaciecola sp.]|jgi:conjugal transfer pilus assembly protein TraK
MTICNKVAISLLPLVLTFSVSAQNEFDIPVKLASEMKLSQPPTSLNAAHRNATKKNSPTNDILSFMSDQDASNKASPTAAELASDVISMTSDIQKQLKSAYKPVQTLKKVKPGSSIMIPVAQGLMNRIKTPFKMVAIRDSGSDATIVDLDGGMVFVTINDYKPMSLMVYEEGVPETMFSIMLQPIDAPPVMIDVDLEITNEMIAKRVAFHEKIEIEDKLQQANNMAKVQTQTSEHERRIKEILAPVAKGDIPRGFSFTEKVPARYLTPCSVSIHQETKQRLIGARELVDVVLIHNDSNEIYSVREEHCVSKDTIAVAVLDKSVLQPGQETEIYILRDKLYEQRQSRVQRRPRLAK